MAEKGIPPIHIAEAEIERIWTEEIKHDFLDRKIMYFESTLQAAFYHHFRTFIDKYPRLRMFLEYSDDETSQRYDLVIQKSQKNDGWPKQDLWTKDVADFWIIMEFKFHPSVSERRAMDDIKKIQNLKKNETIKRVYFLSIDRNVDILRYISYRGTWFHKFYREARGVPSEDKKDWNFFVLKPEEDL